MPANFDWPAFKGPSSAVIKAPRDWADEGLLIPHEAFRWLHSEIRQFLAVYNGEEWKTRLFFDWVERYYIQAAHHHHDVEEKIYFPWLKEQGGTVSAAVATDHKGLINGLEELKAFRPKLEQSRDAVPQFKAFLTQFMNDFEEHLKDEESWCPASLRSSTTQEAESKVVEKIIQSLGLDGNKCFTPTILYAMCIWKGEAAMEEWKHKNLPPPIRMMMDNCWINDFYSNNLSVLKGLQGSEEFTPATPQCSVCTVM